MPELLLGAHMSAAGGPHKAVERASEVHADCLQLFLHPPRAWPPPIGKTAKIRSRVSQTWAEQGELFQEFLTRHAITRPIAHSSYLINLASPETSLWKQSIDAFITELLRAHALGIPHVVLHPGASTSSSESAGLRRVVRALNEVHKQTPDISAQCLLENTAGQGTCLGFSFDHLAAILDQVRAPERLGICFDTCHAFAAGYPLASLQEYRQTMRALNAAVGWDRIKAFHLNDSQRDLGARVDRHEHIGRGKIGLAAFARILNDRRFRRVPMYLETPKGVHAGSGQPWDVINLTRLRRLVGHPID